MGTLKYLVLGVALVGSARAATEDSVSEGRRVAALALTSPDQFLSLADPRFVEAVGGMEKLRTFLQSIKSAGPQLAVEGENIYRTSGAIMYSQVARHEVASLVRTQLTLDSQTGRITGYTFESIDPKPQMVRAGYKSKVRLRLPFGEPPAGSAWHAIWAGPTLIDNYHASKETGYAIDIAPRAIGVPDRPATVFETLCWNLPILASAPGTVVKVVDGNADYRNPRAASPDKGPGNHVIIDHGNKEFTLYAHLRNGSTSVKLGQQVRTGETLGGCGNSGGSTGPHLHFQLMDDSDIDKANGLPLVFHDYFAPVRHVSEGTILRGDFVLPGFSARD